MASLQIVGRRSSHYVRVTRMFAEELGVAYEIVPVYDLTAGNPNIYAENPALKVPALRTSNGAYFGTENICRVIAEHAGNPAGIVWPEQLRGPIVSNAQEMLMHAMQAQVQIVFGTVVCKLPADNIYFTKARTGFIGALGWLDQHVDHILAAMPASRKLSLFEVGLFCALDHLNFRKTVPTDQYESLQRFAKAFGQRPSAQRTPYEFDVAPK